MSALLVSRAHAADAALPNAVLPDAIDFNRDIRPILSDTCFKCHGFDPTTRKANLRLDTAAGATADLGGYAAIVPGKPDQSAALQRMVAHEPDELMPPIKSGLKVTDRQIALVRKWIEQGAPYKSHWAYIAPQRPPVPAVGNGGWVRNPIDAFVLARLEREGLSPSAEADRATLLRRVHLDLTGLPPTPEEVDAFLADTSADAYEKAVDRLLASPHYGERMAQFWLDVARYADSSGYQADWERTMWPWRDWVTDAFNRNLPFDRFTVEQIAGDMLPNATVDQRLASGFNRNHRINDEGGIIPEEYAVEYVVDRVETTSAVFLGQTAGCARCHDHKYDPLTQLEFYRLYAYFNNVPEKGQDGRAGYAAPFMRVPAAADRAKMAELQRELETLAAEMARPSPGAADRQAQWELALGAAPAGWRSPAVKSAMATANVKLNRDGENALTAAGPNPQAVVYEVTLDLAGVQKLAAVRLEMLLNYALVKGPGRGNGNVVLNEIEADLVPAAGKPTPLKFATADADYEQAKFPVAAAIDGNKETGWAVDGDVVREEHAARFALAKLIDVPAGSALRVRLRHDASKYRQYAMGRFRLSVADHAAAPLQSPDAATLAALKIDPARRSAEQSRAVADYFRTIDPAHAELRRRQLAARQQLVALTRTGVAVMVMQEMPTPRDTYLLKRGLYDQPDKSQKLSPGLPAALFPADRPQPKNRLELANWLVSPENPLTARVTVNRFWQQIFGVGLVKTSEDFGFQGEWPSHPELLDWLAVDFRENGWDVKRLMKQIVTSATYRQSAKVTPTLIERDPENRLLARAPRYRLDALAVRDNALAASGLLVRKIGGAPVKPYQPPGLWEELAFSNKTSIDKYVQDTGDSLYRRTMYTFWKRTVPPPALAIFDAAGRETCTVRTSRTNTPLQALNLMNDVTYVEAARVMAARVMHDGGSTAPARLAYAFKLATARTPDGREQALLARSLERYLAVYRADVEAAKKLTTVGDSPAAKDLDVIEHAAYTAVCNVILNLDEAVTRE
jgi:hypothetical protein